MCVCVCEHLSRTHWLEALHGFARKLGSNGMMRERLGEVDQGGGWWNIPPVEKMIQLAKERERVKMLVMVEREMVQSTSGAFWWTYSFLARCCIVGCMIGVSEMLCLNVCVSRCVCVCEGGY